MEKVIVPNWFKIEGKWYHCVAAEEGNELKHYVDGKFYHSVNKYVNILTKRS